MNLEELKSKPAAEQVSMLCECDDETLDLISATLTTDNWQHDVITRVVYTPDELGEAKPWSPSRDLNQAYELLGEVTLHQRVHSLSGVYRHYGYFRGGHSVSAVVRECDAGSHARAVTILAIFGLLQQDPS